MEPRWVLPKLTLRSGKLTRCQVVPMSDVAYWAQYYDLFNSASDVYSLISAQDSESVVYVQSAAC